MADPMRALLADEDRAAEFAARARYEARRAAWIAAGGNKREAPPWEVLDEVLRHHWRGLADPEVTAAEAAPMSRYDDIAATTAPTPNIPISVDTVELLTRAADAAGRVAQEAERQQPIASEYALSELVELLSPAAGRMIAASGPDHWRAVEATFRKQLALHDRDASNPWCMTATLDRPYGRSVGACPALEALRDLAEQVLRDLGDTE